MALPDHDLDAAYVLAVLIDVDDFELDRLARGDPWAAELLVAVEKVAFGCSESHGSSIVRVPPDAWIVTLHGDNPAELVAAGRAYATAVRTGVREAGSSLVTIGVSDAHTGAARVEAAAREAVQALDRKLVRGGDAVYVFDEQRPPEAATPPVMLPDRVEEQLARCIRDGDAQAAVDALRSWIDRISQVEGVTAAVLRQWIAAELLYSLDIAGKRRLRDGSTDWIAACSRLSLDEVLGMFDIHDRSYLVLWLEQLLPRIVEAQAPQSPGRHVLALVEKYICDHYDEDLSLLTVARAAFVSPYYISHLFQRELGTTFLKFLTAVRMQHGRRLLLETDLPVEAVAEQVGYAAAKRFRVLFKRTFHATPTQYRREATEGSNATAAFAGPP